MKQLQDIFDSRTLETVRDYYRANDDTKIQWMSFAHEVTYVRIAEDKLEEIVFEAWWIDSAMSWLHLAYSEKLNQLFIASEVY